MVYKKNLSIAINILLFCTVVFSIGTTNSCLPPPPPNNICLEIDQDLCENADFSNAILNIKRTAKVDEMLNQFGLPYTGGPNEQAFLWTNHDFKCEDNLLVSATDKTLISWKNRYIEGYEINFGPWSKDSYRRYSFAELFEWKFVEPQIPLKNKAYQKKWRGNGLSKGTL